MSHKISVIVPCYNCESFIERCLSSIVSQTYKDLEIIVVNDGSSDDTEKIVSSFLNDPRIKYIKQSNKGEAAARNTGLLAATGEYIGFVDSDDYLEPDMYSKMYQAVIAARSDMAICNYNQLYEDGTQKKCYSTMKGKVFDVQGDVTNYWIKICAAVHPNNYVWSHLYKKSLIDRAGLEFEGFVHSADTLFNFKLLPFVEKVVLVNEGLYNYVQRSGSGIHTVARKQNIAELYADTFQKLADYYKENHYEHFMCVLPIHAYTRFKNVFFYSRLAGINDDEIIITMMKAWKDRDILKYLLGEMG